MPTQIFSADTPELRQAAFAFRYRIYVETMGRRQMYADHGRKAIEEPLDEHGRVFVAIRHGRVIGTIRGNRMSDPATDYYKSLYRLDRFGNQNLSKVQMTTKLMIDPLYSGSGLPARLSSAYMAEGYRNGVRIDIIDCNKHLVGLFERLGYFSYCGWRFHKEYGSVMPMFLAVDALQHLSAVGSILGKPASQVVRDGAYGGYELIEKLATAPALYPRLAQLEQA